MPYLEYKGLLVRRPVLGGVFVVSPDGAIEDLEPEEAARRPELANSGRILPDTQARRIQDAYQYKGGLWNAWFVHEDQTQITDTETATASRTWSTSAATSAPSGSPWPSRTAARSPPA